MGISFTDRSFGLIHEKIPAPWHGLLLAEENANGQTASRWILGESSLVEPAPPIVGGHRGHGSEPLGMAKGQRPDGVAAGFPPGQVTAALAPIALPHVVSHGGQPLFVEAVVA